MLIEKGLDILCGEGSVLYNAGQLDRSGTDQSKSRLKSMVVEQFEQTRPD